LHLLPLADTNASYAFADALLRALAAAGVRDLCICPGSRSAPLAAASLEVPGLRRWVHIDERSAAFFALGLARARRAPVALLCTSGTAALEFAPAVAEAGLSRVPLLVLTADRPPELRDWGASQTLHQERLYGPQVRWFAEAPVPDAADPRLGYARALGARAVCEATGPLPGPVHLNLPFCEPLAPIPEAMLQAPRMRPVVRLGASAGVAPAAVEGLIRFAEETRRGVMIAGPEDASPHLVGTAAAFASRLGWPLLAECASQLRFGPHAAASPVLASGDALLGCEAFQASHAPDGVLRLGAAPTSKVLHQWLARHEQARVVALDVAGGSRDPQQRVDLWLHGAPAELLDAALARLPERPAADPSWLGSFLEAGKHVEELLVARAQAAPLLSAGVVRRLFEALPSGATLMLSNSLAVREADAALPVSSKSLRVLANRGAAGIDGVLSTALGACAAAGPVALLMGDLAFLHDISALLTARRLALSCTVVVLNDDGGGIFDRLPIAAEGARVGFEELFRVSHGTDLGQLVRGFGCEHTRVDDAVGLDRALRDSLRRDGVQVVEIPIDPAENLAAHRACQDAVAKALS